MEQNLRAYFILYGIIIKLIMQVKIELSTMLQRPMLSSSKVSRNLPLARKIKQL